ncbi:MAG: hypothetical protein H6709_01880 [Kofleriaceae bacterium]|nr:hypothetical protein [Myxococcales bacterium]MCB9565111.1 hypothetical protein [Kofleriaceae bacterium]MCB9570819.1 hypothetical protein [Kofleriaceae bacterium]
MRTVAAVAVAAALVAIGGRAGGARADATPGAAASDDPPIRVDVGLTGSIVGVSDRNGTGFVAEIKAGVADHVAVGGRVELAVMFGGQVGDEDLPFGMAAAGLVKGEYLVGGGGVRPFAGLGAGVYAIAAYTIVSDPAGASGVSTTTGRYFGVAPQLGVDLGRVRVAATYNAIVGTSVEYQQTSGGVTHRETFSQRYLSLELSFRFGGTPAPAAR